MTLVMSVLDHFIYFNRDSRKILISSQMKQNNHLKECNFCRKRDKEKYEMT